MIHNNPYISIAYLNRLFADGLEAIIRNLHEFEISFVAPVGLELFEHLEGRKEEQILILEASCPGKKELEIIQQLCKSFPFVRILMLSHMPRKRIGMCLIESGISGYLLKSCSEQDLIHAILKIIDDKPYFCSKITSHLINGKQQERGDEDYCLTKRETEVLHLLVNSYSNKQIACMLEMSENTVKTHRKNIHTKFGVTNLLGMVVHAYRSNLIEAGNNGYCYGCPHEN